MLADADDAYANAAHIAGADRFPPAWARAADAFRTEMLEAGRAEFDIAYGEGARQRLDLFRPVHEPKGLFVFVHGGYWKAFGKSDWSHLARGALDRGWAAVLPGYTLAPDARLSRIGREVAEAVAVAASRVGGPIVLCGHSAGGHLVVRLVSEGTALPAGVLARLRRVVPVSGLFDLRPLMATAMNAVLGLDEAQARAESPALLRPAVGVGKGAPDVLAWVGAAERPEFRRQSALIANIWTGLDATTRLHEEPGRHHFDVVDDLADPRSRLLDLALG